MMSACAHSVCVTALDIQFQVRTQGGSNMVHPFWLGEKKKEHEQCGYGCSAF